MALLRRSLLDWFRSFLSDRHMKVVVDGEASRDEAVLSGVPPANSVWTTSIIYLTALPHKSVFSLTTVWHIVQLEL